MVLHVNVENKLSYIRNTNFEKKKLTKKDIKDKQDTEDKQNKTKKITKTRKYNTKLQKTKYKKNPLSACDSLI